MNCILVFNIPEIQSRTRSPLSQSHHFKRLLDVIAYITYIVKTKKHAPKNFINHSKKLLHLLYLKSISEKRSL